ncbi:MAG: zinc-binding dehydrogenase [Ilumatobacteraceae bacterium]
MRWLPTSTVGSTSRGTHATLGSSRRRSIRLVGLVASGQVKVQVGDTLPIADAAEAHRNIEARETTGRPS